MKIETIPPSGWDRRLVAEWDRLLQEAREPTVFLSPGWILAWWRHFGEGKEPFLLIAREEDGRVGGIAPLYRSRLRLAGAPGPTRLGLMSDEGVGSEYLGFLAPAGREADLLRPLAERLRGEWALLDLHGLREGEWPATLAGEILAAGAPERIHREFHPCQAFPLPEDYEAYLATLAQKFRTTLRYRTNKLIKNHSVRLIRTAREEEIDPHLNRLFAMHQARWVAEGHPGSFYHPRKRAFYRDVAADFLQRGWLRFFQLEVDGVIRASQFGFAFRGVLHSLQEAFDHDFHPPGVGGVGVVLRGMAIRDCIAEGLRSYDFLGGGEEFKFRWNTTVHRIQRVRIGAPGPAGALAFALTAGVRRAKDWGRDRSPAWLMEGRERLRAWRRARKVRETSPDTGGTGG